MSFRRAVLVAFATIFATGVSSAAFAGCGGCGFGTPAPAIYAQPAPFYAQPSPVYAPQAPVYVPSGCGGCGASVAPVFVAPAPIAVDHWDTGGFGGCGGLGGLFGGCGGFGGCGCGRSAGYAQPVAPSPLYVVNQGPEYSGPGIVVPYRTYAPAAAFAPAINYPYIGARYRYRGPGYYHYRIYRGPRFAYHARVFVHPRYYRPRPR